MAKHALGLFFERTPALHAEKFTFQASFGGSLKTWTAFGAGQASGSQRVFPEIRGVKVLWLALTRLKLAELRNSLPGMPLLIGGDGSAAYTFAQALLHPDRFRWLVPLFEPDFTKPEGISERIIKSFFSGKHSNHAIEGEPVRVFAEPGANGLRGEDVTIYVGGVAAGIEELMAIQSILANEVDPQENEYLISGTLAVHDSVLVGREAEMEKLQRMEREGNVRLVEVLASGGVGKTGLVANWLRQRLNGQARIFVWSFHRQGFSEKTVQLMWPFRAALAAVLGVEVPLKATARQTVEIFREGLLKSKTLLVLDGVEAVLHPPGDAQEGEFRDDVLPLLIQAILEVPTVFCVATSRQKIALAKGKESLPVGRIELPVLSHASCRKLLRQLGVTGTSRDLEEAANFTEGRPLLVRLLSGLYHSQKLLGLNALPLVLAELRRPLKANQGLRRLDPAVVRMMRVYEKWLDGTRELALLRVCCLFESVPDEKAVWAVLNDPEQMGGLLRSFSPAEEERWTAAADNLRLYEIGGGRGGLGLEIHPITQSYFAERTRNEMPAAWKAGHRALYRHFAGEPDEETPETLPELNPLLKAVQHGCMAGDYFTAFSEVAMPRISRGFEGHILVKLGAVQATLSMLASFFAENWQFPEDSDLPPAVKGAILNAVAACHRLNDEHLAAEKYFRRSMKYCQGGASALYFSSSVCHRLRIYLVIGKLRSAVKLVSKYGSLAEFEPKTDLERKWMHMFKAVIAQVLMAAGRGDAAEAVLKPAIDDARRATRNQTLLPELGSIYHSAILVEQGRTKELVEAVERGEAYASVHRFEYGNGAALVAGRAWLEHAIRSAGKQRAECSAKALASLDEALAQARDLGRHYLIAQALWLHAKWQAHFGEEAAFFSTINECREASTARGFRMLLVEISLLEAEYFAGQGDGERSRGALKELQALVRKTGYRLRENELKRLSAN